VQHLVPCLGQEILLLVTSTGNGYVSLTNSCAVLGLNSRGQLQRIQRTPQLCRGLRQFVVQTRGGSQRVNCLQVECIPEWLSGINSRMGGHIINRFTYVGSPNWLKTHRFLANF
jgi:hypothetical protein